MRNSWFKSEIEGKAGKIADNVERIKFLYDEKTKFLSMDLGVDADHIKFMFENLIEKEKLLNELSKNTNQEFGLFIDSANNSNIKKNTAESERLHNQLNEIAKEIQAIKNWALEIDPKKENEYENLKIKFYECVLELYHQSETENYFWQFCPFSVYKYHLNSRFSEYRKEFPDVSREDFLMDEIKDIKRNILQKGDGLISSPDPSYAEELKLKEKNINYLLHSGQILIERDFFNLSVFQKFEQTQKRKTEFLLEKIEELTNLKTSNHIYSKNIEDMEHEDINNKTNNSKYNAAFNKFAEIFQSGGYELFYYLNEHYTSDNKSPIAKYSNLFRFLQYEKYILCTQIEFKAFIKSEYKITMSKILPKNYKYSDKIQPILTQLMFNYKANEYN